MYGSSALPLQFEGTPGVYAKRESPPKIPSTHYKESHFPTNAVAFDHAPPSSIQFSPRISLINFENKRPQSDVFHQSLRRQSHTPQRNTRKAAPRHELSSHSFNVPHSAAQRQTKIGQRRFGKPSSMENAQTNHESEGLSRQSQGRLCPSASFGNFTDPLMIPPIALQHVYATANMVTQANVDQSNKLDLDRLPPGWEVRLTEDGSYRYYVDHNNGRTHWIHPFAPEVLKPNWTKIFDTVHGVVYYNHVDQRSQFDHPGFINGAFLPTIHGSSSFQSLLENEQEPNCNKNDREADEESDFLGEEDLNLINNEDVPEWLKLYSQAPFNSDHLLNFNLFKLNQLEAYDRMIMRLYKQDVINTVVKYEGPMSEIDNELMQRHNLT
ncbi:hypothetical protein niasHS_006918 [Heterodera schachtii]|uniref:WW domain-containing protein n=1 Tax=Heterodera schachtii TaxID=97005 RepID=A0ABD2JFZ6_HETSC